MRSPHDADAHAPVYARLTNGFSKKLEKSHARHQFAFHVLQFLQNP
jgi:hypothetical protein